MSPERNLGIVIDSSASLPPRRVAELRRTTGVPIISLPNWVEIDGKHVRDQSLNLNYFYQKLTESDKLLDTSQINPGQAKKAFEALIKMGKKEIISIHADARLTGGINSAKVAADMVKEEYPEVKIQLFDSQSVSASIGLLTLEVIEMASQGLLLEEITERLEKEKENIKLLMAITDLNYLIRSASRRLNVDGFVRMTAAALMGLVNVYPIITLKEGNLRPVKIIRGKAKVEKGLSEVIRNEGELKRAIVIHTGCPEEAQELAQFLKDNNINVFDVWDAGILAVYGGKGIIGAAIQKA